jgi:hypothetical protein
MKVVVETSGNEIISDYCFKGYIGAINQGHDAEKMSLPAVSMMQGKLKQERPMPIGSVGYMEYFFNLYGIEKPEPLLPAPKSQGFYTTDKRKDLVYPVFVKPLKDVKMFTGAVFTKASEWDLYPDLGDWDGPYLCRPPFELKILSEWRCFVHKNKIVNVSSYNSEQPDSFPSKYIINAIVDILAEQDIPVAYSLDVALLEGGVTEFIELNDMWAIGPYGCDEETYFKMLKDRWNEIVEQNETNIN